MADPLAPVFEIQVGTPQQFLWGRGHPLLKLPPHPQPPPATAAGRSESSPCPWLAHPDHDPISSPAPSVPPVAASLWEGAGILLPIISAPPRAGLRGQGHPVPSGVMVLRCSVCVGSSAPHRGCAHRPSVPPSASPTNWDSQLEAGQSCSFLCAFCSQSPCVKPIFPFPRALFLF